MEVQPVPVPEDDGDLPAYRAPQPGLLPQLPPGGLGRGLVALRPTTGNLVPAVPLVPPLEEQDATVANEDRAAADPLRRVFGGIVEDQLVVPPAAGRP